MSPVFQRDGLEHDAVVARAERPLVCIQLYLAGSSRFGRRRDTQTPRIGLVQRLVVFLADIDLEDAPLAGSRSAAVFGIEVQTQNIAPMSRLVQHRACRCKRVIDERINVTRHPPRVSLELHMSGRWTDCDGVDPALHRTWRAEIAESASAFVGRQCSGPGTAGRPCTIAPAPTVPFIPDDFLSPCCRSVN